ncbi:Gmad2 immunoglobulin-like domain-containing protein [Patescibacteria group bacterium]|nr:Gmad2 immunoglobulin-like domain-containing protein [Patescibacteria group bacterium]
MRGRYKFIFSALILIILAGIYWFYIKEDAVIVEPIITPIPTPVQGFNYKDLIIVDNPLQNSVIQSPLKFSGQARGTWYFEATFPVLIVDWDGRIIAQSYATAHPPTGGDWMTEDLVPFEGIIEFEDPSFEDTFSKRGAIIFKKDNPSDLPEYDDALEIPISF